MIDTLPAVDFDATSFHRVVTDCACVVSVREDSAHGVLFEGEGIRDSVLIDLEGDVLRLSQDPEAPLSAGTITITAPRITSVVHQGAGSVLVEVGRTQRLALASYGSGPLSATGKAAVVLASLHGDGDMRLQGLGSAHAKLVNRGAGNLHAVVTASCRLDRTGTGSIRLNEHLPALGKLPPDLPRAKKR